MKRLKCYQNENGKYKVGLYITKKSDRRRTNPFDDSKPNRVIKIEV